MPGAETRARPTVLSIAGTGQNGATLLSRLLGELPGFVPVGEIGFLWNRALIGGWPCGCGERFEACGFWRQVGEAAFGGWGVVDAQEITQLRNEVLRRRRHLSLPLALPLIVRPGLSAGYREAVDRYVAVLDRLYRGISEVSGGAVIVDSTKVAAHVFLLRRMADVRQRVVHLVRDSRGVAHSSTKVVERPVAVDGQAHRPTHPPARTAARWMWINLAFEVLPRLGVPTTVLGYEELVRSPREELARVAGFAAGRPVEEGDLAFLHGGGAELGPSHLAAGNRMRMAAGWIPLRVDEGWRTGLAARDRRLVHAMTWPLMRRYAVR